MAAGGSKAPDIRPQDDSGHASRKIADGNPAVVFSNYIGIIRSPSKIYDGGQLPIKVDRPMQPSSDDTTFATEPIFVRVTEVEGGKLDQVP